MSNSQKYLIINSDVLPDVFLKVVEARELIAKGLAKNSSKACELVGLSRSTFYRYRDSVDVFDNDISRAVTLYLSLNDKPGVLAEVLNILRGAEANVLTINQSIPINGVAPVCISIRDSGVSKKIFDTVDLLRNVNDVVDVKLVK